MKSLRVRYANTFATALLPKREMHTPLIKFIGPRSKSKFTQS